MTQTGHSKARRTRFAGAAFALLLLGIAPLRAQDIPAYVVLASTVPSLAVGALIDDGATLDVPQGASLTLIDPAGQIKVIEGPFLGRLRADDRDETEPSFLRDLANIIAEADTADVALGMGRSTLAPEVSPWLIAFDQELADDLCVSPGGQLVFYRADAGVPESETVHFIPADAGPGVNVTWPADDPLMRWPEELPPVDGQDYYIDRGHAIAPPAVTLHLAPTDLASDAHAAVWLARSGCRQQAEAMVRRMALGG
ncbi:MAG: hypothetical protein ACFCVH_12245 [Alphaproteobacteria bacterium]